MINLPPGVPLSLPIHCGIYLYTETLATSAFRSVMQPCFASALLPCYPYIVVSPLKPLKSFNINRSVCFLQTIQSETKPYGNTMPKKALHLSVTRKDSPRKDPPEIIMYFYVF